MNQPIFDIRNNYLLQLLGCSSLLCAAILCWQAGIVSGKIVVLPAALIPLFAFYFVPRTSYYILLALTPTPMLLPEGLPFRDIGSACYILLFLALILRDGQTVISKAKSAARNPAGLVLLVAFILYTGLSALRHGLQTELVQYVFHLIGYLCLFLSTVTLLRDREKRQTGMIILLAATLLVNLYSYYQIFTGEFGFLWHLLWDGGSVSGDWEGRVRSIFPHDNPYAAYLNLTIAVAAALVLDEGKKKIRRFCFFVMGTSAISLILTQSRGGLISLFAAVATCMLFRKIPSKLRMGFFGVLVVFVILGFTLVRLYPDRFTSIDSSGDQFRLVLYATAWGSFLEAPLLGHGMGSMVTLVSETLTSTDVIGVHNMYLQMLAEAGLIGTFLFLAFLVQTLWSAFRNCNSGLRRIGIPAATVASIVVVMVHGTVDDMTLTRQVMCLFYFILGLYNSTLLDPSEIRELSAVDAKI